MSDGKHKFEEYELPYGTNEKHASDEFDPKKDAGVNNPDSRHRDKVLDEICDTHPTHPPTKEGSHSETIIVYGSSCVFIA